MTSLTVIVFVGFASAFSPSIYVFAVSRFVTGLAAPGIQSQCMIILSESVGNKYRAFALSLFFNGFFFGSALLAMIAYLTQSWKLLVIFCTAPFALLLLFNGFVPESLRWYRSKERLEDASKCLKVMAKWNRKSFPDGVTVTNISAPKNATLLDLFRSRSMSVRTLVVGYTWMVQMVQMYGLTFAANNLGGSIYVDYIILVFANIPPICSPPFL